MIQLKKFVRDIPDFPKKGISFKDITPLLAEGRAFSETIKKLADAVKDKKIDKIVAVEARGFIFGGALANKIGCGLIPVRKKGKLPYRTKSVSYDLEYGTDTLEMHEDAISKGEKILIVDDVLATGGTVSAVARMVEEVGGEIEAIEFLIELTFLKGIEKIKNYKVHSLIKY